MTRILPPILLTAKRDRDRGPVASGRTWNFDGLGSEEPRGEFGESCASGKKQRVCSTRWVGHRDRETPEKVRSVEPKKLSAKQPVLRPAR